jgi:hypothetical protein
MPSLFELIRSNHDNYPTADALGRPDGPFLDHVSLHRIVVTMGETLRSIGIERGTESRCPSPTRCMLPWRFLRSQLTRFARP